jgi:hypothetical protein
MLDDLASLRFDPYLCALIGARLRATNGCCGAIQTTLVQITITSMRWNSIRGHRRI